MKKIFNGVILHGRKNYSVELSPEEWRLKNETPNKEELAVILNQVLEKALNESLYRSEVYYHFMRVLDKYENNQSEWTESRQVLLDILEKVFGMSEAG